VSTPLDALPPQTTAPSSPDDLAARLRGFGPLGLLAIAVIFAGNLIVLPLSAILVLVWARWSETPWKELGYVRPATWIGELSLGIAFGAALKLLMKSIVMPLLGADPINHAYHYLAGNPAAIPATLFLLTAGAGFGEETLFRGYLFERLGKLLGAGIAARTAIVLITALWFGLLHYPVQGLAGAEQATLVGLVFGTIFALRRSLFLLMCAHAAFDLTAYLLIYRNLESAVAHLVFP
jgi:membrane protease YdiL (CAAX protease family)